MSSKACPALLQLLKLGHTRAGLGLCLALAAALPPDPKSVGWQPALESALKQKPDAQPDAAPAIQQLLGHLYSLAQRQDHDDQDEAAAALAALRPRLLA